MRLYPLLLLQPPLVLFAFVNLSTIYLSSIIYLFTTCNNQSHHARLYQHVTPPSTPLLGATIWHKPQSNHLKILFTIHTTQRDCFALSVTNTPTRLRSLITPPTTTYPHISRTHITSGRPYLASSNAFPPSLVFFANQPTNKPTNQTHPIQYLDTSIYDYDLHGFLSLSLSLLAKRKKAALIKAAA